MSLPENVVRTYSGTAVKTSLAEDINETATGFAVGEAASFPEPPTGSHTTVTLDRGGPNEEVISYADKNGNRLQNVIRGIDGSIARTHRTGESVEHTSTAIDFREANKHVNDKTPSYVPHDQSVHVSVAQTISADHEVTGAWTFSGPLTVQEIEATNVQATTADFDTIAGPVAFTGAVTQRKVPQTPNKIANTTGNKGNSDVFMREDATIPIDARALVRIMYPAGFMMQWPVASLPTDEGHDGEWAFAEGSLVPKAQYPQYAKNVGTKYGGTADAPALPNVRGRVPVGSDGAHALGAYGGSRTAQLGPNELPTHNHAIADVRHDHDMGNDFGARFLVTADGTSLRLPANGTASGQSLAVGDISPAFSGINHTENQGAGQPFNIEQPWYSVNWIVKVH